jgi:hypothetical protein
MATRTLFLLLTLPLFLGLGLLSSYCLELSSRLRRCQEECRKLRAHRDELRRRLDALERQHSESRTSPSLSPREGLDRFAKLRALVIKTLHPDNAPRANAIEKEVRSEMFKAVWPEIVRIENENPPAFQGWGDAAMRGQFQNSSEAPSSRRRDAAVSGWRERRNNATVG